MPKVKIYTTATCVYCNAEKNFLKEHGIDFEEVPVDTNQEAAEEMVHLSGQLGVPFTVITPEDGGEPHYVLGFDQPQLREILGIA